MSGKESSSPKVSRKVRPDRSHRVALLEATVGVALEKGFGNVTIEAVAERAGISKGGLLYHFPTKRKLIEELLRAFVLEQRRPAEGKASACSQSSIDCRRAAILIAAAESPALVECTARAIGISLPATGSDGVERNWQLLAACLDQRWPFVVDGRRPRKASTSSGSPDPSAF